MKNQPTEETTVNQMVHWQNLTLQDFFKEYLGASHVMANTDGDGTIEITFSDNTPGLGSWLSIAELRPNNRFGNIHEITKAMRETFTETGYPK